MFYAVHDDTTGTLISIGTTVADDLEEQGMTAVEVGEDMPDLGALVWDTESRVFVPAPDPEDPA